MRKVIAFLSGVIEIGLSGAALYSFYIQRIDVAALAIALLALHRLSYIERRGK